MTSDKTSSLEFVDDKTDSEVEARTPQSPPKSTSGGGTATGAGAVVSVGLGLASVVGTPLADMMRSRQDLLGQIDAATGVAGDEIDAIYGAPWNMTALVNGAFALVAALVGAVLVGMLAARKDERTWVRALAWAGVALGVIGLLIAGGMYFDLFAPQPELPLMPANPMGG
ncbi:hypothetical protein [Hoyosella altamirensis]|uniref:Uncharacterized protein n=1 Tax=Hoyosella altamirensis TaxID=616997 RepID=A0A839RSS9_9ACTN|nr:hypothetical protein [Hoyosella altamirensis]MBB3038973.1 hypothetical protein [Hoyosella altamirensis]